MTLDLDTNLPKAVIKVIGVGGGGGNAIDTMIKSDLGGVDFIACNTDVQALRHSLAPHKIQIGKELTRGLGAGADPDIGREAALEDRAEIEKHLKGADMVFITAGMGGGTGTGAAAVVSSIAREIGALTVAVVTKPFIFEGKRRRRYADSGIDRLRQCVDTLITIPNQRLLAVAPENLSMIDAFKMADDVLVNAVKGISDIINVRGQVNVDFADARAVMSCTGQALMGIGRSHGSKRASEAARMAISSPLLEDVDIEGATGILINISAGSSCTIHEISAACEVIQEAAHEDANIIFGVVLDETLGEELRVTVIATGFPVDRDEETSLSKPSPSQTPPSKTTLEHPTSAFRRPTHLPSYATAVQSPPAQSPPLQTPLPHSEERPRPSQILDLSGLQDFDSDSKSDPLPKTLLPLQTSSLSSNNDLFDALKERVVQQDHTPSPSSAAFTDQSNASPQMHWQKSQAGDFEDLLPYDKTPLSQDFIEPSNTTDLSDNFFHLRDLSVNSDRSEAHDLAQWTLDQSKKILEDTIETLSDGDIIEGPIGASSKMPQDPPPFSVAAPIQDQEEVQHSFKSPHEPRLDQTLFDDEPEDLGTFIQKDFPATRVGAAANPQGFDKYKAMSDENLFDIDRRIDEALALADRLKDPHFSPDDELDTPTFLRRLDKDLGM